MLSIEQKKKHMMVVGDLPVTNFFVKVHLFNNYFSQQFTKMGNKSSIPANITFKTKERLPKFGIY